MLPLVSVAVQRTMVVPMGNSAGALFVTLAQNHGSLTRTAEQLKLSRHALRYRMHRLGITVGLEGDTEHSEAPAKDGAL